MAAKLQDSRLEWRMHPLTKFTLLICFCIVILILSNLLFSFSMLFIILLLVNLSGISLRAFLKRGRFILVFSLILFVTQILFVREGETLFLLIPASVPVIGGALEITNIGVETGLVMASRFLCIVTSSFLFVSSTDPNSFVYALMQLGLPYRYGFTLITTLRFLPLFGSELNVVRQAQAARGMQTSIHPKKVVRTIRMTFLPMLVSGLAKVDALSISMEGRGFGAHKQRTFLRKIVFTPVDLLICAIAALSTAAIIILPI